MRMEHKQETRHVILTGEKLIHAVSDYHICIRNSSFYLHIILQPEISFNPPKVNVEKKGFKLL